MDTDYRIAGLSSQAFAEQHCNRGEHGCSWYHGSWHLLKSLSLVSTSAVHAASIERLLTLAIANTQAPRILVTGSSDETMLQLAHNACHSMGIKESFTAVDICATPLAFMQRFAEQHQLTLTTQQADILEFEPPEKFDIILTHAFMGYFDQQQRPRLLDKWRQLLSPAGRIVTIQRVRPEASAPLVKFSSEQSRHFIQAALAAGRDAGKSAAELIAIESTATAFTKNFVNHAIRSKTALESLFLDAGLEFQLLEYQQLQKQGALSGPSVPSDAEFAHIIAKIA